MENITSLEIKKIDVHLEKIGDFMYHEGPLLSLYKDRNNEDNYYFYKWVDCDDACNRWLIFLVTAENLRGFLFEEFSLYQLIEKNQLVFLVDLDNDFVQKKCLVAKTTDLPSNYLPSKKNSFYKQENYTEIAHHYKVTLRNNNKSSVRDSATLNFILEGMRNFEKRQEFIANQMKEILTFISDKNATKVG